MNRMARSLFISAIVVTLGLSGCNLPAARPTSTALQSDTPAPILTKVSPAETRTVEPPPPTAKPADTEVPTAAPTDRPASPVASAIDMDVACRFGPGEEFSIEGAVRVLFFVLLYIYRGCYLIIFMQLILHLVKPFIGTY